MGLRTLRVSVPYNLVRSKKGTVGLDAYFWNSLSLEARRALLIRPGSLLEGKPREGYRPLPVRVGVPRQLYDVERLASAHLSWASRHVRWKLARLLFPAREPPGGWEYLHARNIVEGLGLGLDSEPVGLGWLHVEFRLERGEAVLSGHGGIDRVYTWLVRRDPGFAGAVRGL